MIIAPNPSFPIVESNRTPVQTMRDFMKQVEREGMVIGTGTPEGVVSAVQGRFYMDEAGAPGAILYIKQLSGIGGDDSQGWVVLA